MTAGGNNTGNGSGDTKLKCDRGILLNSNLTAKSIFEETLYSINYLDIMGVDSSGRIQLEKDGIYAKKILLMDKCYIQNIFRFYNLGLTEIKTNKQLMPVDYELNSSGLYTTNIPKTK
jgi:hypothetical protein